MNCYELILINESNDNNIEKYYIKHNGRLIMNDYGRRFQLELRKNDHMIIFRTTSINAHDVYSIMNLIRKKFGYAYTIKSI